jgi:hypothetical protein
MTNDHQEGFPMTDEQVPVVADHTHAPSTGRVEISLEQLAMLQPGVARLMLEVSNRYSRAFHAAKAKNGRLARFQIGEGTKVLRICGIMNPKYEKPIDQFIQEHVNPLRDLVGEGRWDEFDPAWEAMTVEINRWHEEFDHGFLVWHASANPPADLDLTPLPE